MAIGSPRAGSARFPGGERDHAEPRNAKNVGATLAKTPIHLGERRHDEHREDGEHEHDDRRGARSTIREPTRLIPSVSSTTAQVKTLLHARPAPWPTNSDMA